MSNKDMDNISPKKRNKKGAIIHNDSSSDTDSGSDEPEQKINDLDFQKLLASLFPSKVQNEKVKKMEVIKKLKRGCTGKSRYLNPSYKKKECGKNRKKGKKSKDSKLGKKSKDSKLEKKNKDSKLEKKGKDSKLEKTSKDSKLEKKSKDSKLEKKSKDSKCVKNGKKNGKRGKNVNKELGEKMRMMSRIVGLNKPLSIGKSDPDYISTIKNESDMDYTESTDSDYIPPNMDDESSCESGEIDESDESGESGESDESGESGESYESGESGDSLEREEKFYEQLDEEIKDYQEEMMDGLGASGDMKELLKGNNMKFNIIFTNPSHKPGLYEDEEYEYNEHGENSDFSEYEEKEYCEYSEECSSEDDDHIEECDELSDKKQTNNKMSNKSLKNGDKVKVKLKDWDKYYRGIIIKVNKNTKKTKNGGKGKNGKNGKNEDENITYNIKLKNDEYETMKNILPKYIKLVESVDNSSVTTLKELESLISLKNNKGNKAMLRKFNQMSKVHEKKMEKKKKAKERKEKIQNLKEFKKALNGKNTVNDFKYFKDMSLEKQLNLVDCLKQMNDYSIVEKPHRIQLIESEIPIAYKINAMKKINSLRWMDPGSGEYYKIKQWVDTFMTIPFGKHNTLPVSINDEKEKYNDFMEEAKKTLDDAVYGLDDAKMQILQLVGQWISNPSSVGTAIAIKGPMGTGKTTLVKEGISKILNRPFAFMALGGATDSSFLEGHSYTYEGSSWGKIIDILIQSKCMNPVIYFDELDKISNTPKGEEITGILTHLTDTAQNDKYHDKYFSSIDFDLSKALFIFSYNDESKINPILKDRMYRISTDGYNNKDKGIIANKHLLPKIMKNVNFNKGEIIIPNETIEYISEHLVEKEKGVRNLKRGLEIVYTKLNLYRLMKRDSSLFDKEKSFEVKFPFTVTIDIVKKLVKKKELDNIPFGMYM